ncbi:MAG: hypothetical protein KKF30_09985 [Proteobacteria bacterium]|nr:hypothetical protein [Pseudomonadota bacterium]MBU4468870.1 hypothetical protein [Pseudomonadota bacterium]MCG2750863.1 DUF6178 family protein [Desulfobacteraceae bacterium]
MASFVSKLKQPHELLNHILDQPELPAIIRSLDAGVLAKVIHHIGLEDSGEIVSLATADQLKGIFDEDLWQSNAPGKTEAFNADRFGLWLEILLESGSEFAARKVMELDEALVALGFCRLVLVKDRFAPARPMRDDSLSNEEEPMIRTMGGALKQSFDHYLVMAKSHSRWDAVCALLVELNELDDEKLTRLLENCCRISGEQMEDNGGLLNVLSAEEMLEEDLADERDARREEKGFVTPHSASSFLAKTRSTPMNKILGAKTPDPATRAYFAASETASFQATKFQPDTEPPGNKDSENLDLKVISFLQTLQAAEVLPASVQKQLGFEGTESPGLDLPLTKAIRWINHTDPNLYSRLLMEISYLSNTLISGCEFKGRPFDPKEAAEGVLSVCNLGADFVLGGKSKSEESPLDDLWPVLLKKYHLVKLFQVGWKILLDHVSLYTAEVLLGFLVRLKDKPLEPWIRSEMISMARVLKSCVLSGHPWKFNPKMDGLLTVLDGQTTTALKALLEEYPTLSECICSKGAHPVSPYISSKAHIRTLRKYLKEML